MKLPLFGLLLALLAGGCTTRYDLIMNNGTAITSVGKPKLLPEGYYKIIDMNGQEKFIPKMRVRTIQPSSDSNSDQDAYGVKQSGGAIGPSSSGGRDFFLKN